MNTSTFAGVPQIIQSGVDFKPASKAYEGTSLSFGVPYSFFLSFILDDLFSNHIRQARHTRRTAHYCLKRNIHRRSLIDVGSELSRQHCVHAES